MRFAPVVLLSSLIVAGVAAPPALAQARIYCCNDAQGRKVCSDFLPPECVRRAYEERDDKGFVISRKDAPLTPEQIARREAEAAKKAEDEKKRIEDRRRNLALLSTYATEKDIDISRDRALTELQNQIAQADKQLEESVRNRGKAEKEKEFYKNKALPPPLKKQLADADADVKAKQEVVTARKQDVERTRLKFEDEKKRFRELKGMVSPGPATIVPLAPEIPAASVSPTAPATPATEPGKPAVAPLQPPVATPPAAAPATPAAPAK